MMDYRVIALEQQTADEVRTTLRAPGYGHPAHVEMAKGSGPCRLCLRPFRKDEEERVLFTYNPFPDGADLPSPGPIFVHRASCERFEGAGFPPELGGLPLTLEGYDDRGVAVARVKASDPDASVRDVLARPGVAYAHLRHSEAGCFIARIERASSQARRHVEVQEDGHRQAKEIRAAVANDRPA
jgi:Protein of unknown function (DUF1203)